MKLITTSVLALSSFAAISATAQTRPVVLTRNMTCEQTREYSDRYGRVYVVANKKDVIPLYGYVDSCPTGLTASPLYVRTTDKNECLIGYRCYED